MAEMDGRYRGASSHQPDSASPANRHVLGRILGFHSASKERVIHLGYGLPKLCNPSHGRIITVIDRHLHGLDSMRSPRKRTGFGLTLAKVDPVGIVGAKSAFFGLRRDIDDPRPGYRTEGSGHQALSSVWGRRFAHSASS